MPNKAEEDCGECENCKHVDYISEEPDTHCVECNCLYCIPGA